MTSPATPPGNHADDALPSFKLVLLQVTSIVIYTRRSQLTFTGTLPALEAAYRTVLRHNLLAGWWGFPFGIVWTPLALLRNRTTMRKLRQLGASPSGAGTE
ncbi:MAG: hypothetical protein M0035_11985 [Actinomycetota bacterium]|nr:hypothetical protein [Actinomycetota bacterium]